MRRTTAHLADRAVHSLITTIGSVGLEANAVADGSVSVDVDGRAVRFDVRAISYVTGSVAAGLVGSASSAESVPVVVADRVTAEARSILHEAGWSWLDRRGRLRLVAPGIRVDMEVAAEADEPSRNEAPLRGRSGLEIGYWLCAHPGEALSPTGHADELDLAPSTISVGVRRLVEAGLVDDSGAAYLPELFWELASIWQPKRWWLVGEPHGVDGWHTGTGAAAAYGAPIVTTDAPIDLYVRNEVQATALVRGIGQAAPGLGVAVVAAAPTPQVCVAGDVMVGSWPAAPLLAVALDLASDRARGREILEDWSHPDAVWR